MMIGHSSRADSPSALIVFRPKFSFQTSFQLIFFSLQNPSLVSSRSPRPVSSAPEAYLQPTAIDPLPKEVQALKAQAQS